MKYLEFIFMSEEGSLSKLEVLNQIYNFMLIITNQCIRSGNKLLPHNWLPLQI